MATPLLKSGMPPELQLAGVALGVMLPALLAGPWLAPTAPLPRSHSQVFEKAGIKP